MNWNNTSFQRNINTKLSGSMRNLNKILPSTAYNRLYELNNLRLVQGQPTYNILGSSTNLNLTNRSKHDLTLCHCDELRKDPALFYSLEKKCLNNHFNVGQSNNNLFSMRRSASVPGRRGVPGGLLATQISQQNNVPSHAFISSNQSIYPEDFQLHRSQINLNLSGYVPPYKHQNSITNATRCIPSYGASQTKMNNQRSRSWGDKINKISTRNEILQSQRAQQQQQQLVRHQQEYLQNYQRGLVQEENARFLNGSKSISNLKNINSNVNYDEIVKSSVNRNILFQQKNNLSHQSGYDHQFQTGYSTMKTRKPTDLSFSTIFRKKFHETNLNGCDTIKFKSTSNIASERAHVNKSLYSINNTNKYKRYQHPFTVSNSWKPMEMQIPNEANIDVRLVNGNRVNVRNQGLTNLANSTCVPALPKRSQMRTSRSRMMGDNGNTDMNQFQYKTEKNDAFNLASNMTQDHNSIVSIIEALQKATETINRSNINVENYNFNARATAKNEVESSEDEEEEIEYRIIPRHRDRQRGLSLNEQIRRLKEGDEKYTENITIINRKDLNDASQSNDRRTLLKSGSITIEDVYDTPPIMSFIEDENEERGEGILETHFPGDDRPAIPTHRGNKNTRILLEETESGLAKFSTDKSSMNLPLRDYTMNHQDMYTQNEINSKSRYSQSQETMKFDQTHNVDIDTLIKSKGVDERNNKNDNAETSVNIISDADQASGQKQTALFGSKIQRKFNSNASSNLETATNF